MQKGKHMATQINASDLLPRRSAHREEKHMHESGASPAQRNAPQLSEEEVSSLAYQLWMERGCPIGEPERDWFQAEEVIREQKHVDAAA